MSGPPLDFSSPPPVRPEPPSSSRRGWVLGGIGAVAVVVIGLVALKLVGGSSSTKTVASGGAATTVAPGDGGGAGGGPGGRGRGTSGAIASIDGATFTLTSPNGAIQVVTTGTTTFSSTVTGAMTDLKVGDNVVIQGTLTGTNVAADRITDSGTVAPGAGGRGGFGGNGGPPPTGQPPGGQTPPGAGRGRPVVGTVAGSSGTTATVTAADGTTYTVATAPTTTISLVRPGSLAALQVGQSVRVTGTTADDGTVTATSVREGVTGGPPGP